jgi:hypothetical protein
LITTLAIVHLTTYCKVVTKLTFDCHAIRFFADNKVWSDLEHITIWQNTLTSLKLGGNIYVRTIIQWEILQTIILQCTKITEFKTISVSRIKSASEVLLPIIHTWSSSLQKLDISYLHNFIDFKMMDNLTKSCPNLTHLQLNIISEASAQLIGNRLNYLEYIECWFTLHEDEQNLEPDINPNLMSILHLSKSFAEIHTLNFKLNSSAFKFLMSGIPFSSNESREKYELDNAHTKPFRVKYNGNNNIITVLLPKLINLTTLTLHNSINIPDTHLILTHCTQITSLDMSSRSRNLNNSDLIIISTHIKLLKYLNLSSERGTKVTDTGVIAIVTTNPRLRRLNIQGCIVSTPTLETISSLLPYIRQSDLDYNEYIGDKITITYGPKKKMTPRVSK